MKLRTSLLALALLASACGKKKDVAPAPEPVATTGSGSADAAVGSGSAVQSQTEIDKVAAAIAKNMEADAKEAARWTPEMEKDALELRNTEWPDTNVALTNIVESPHREPGNKERDVWRHPEQTLAFFGVKTTSTVVEVGAGGGWYTELLAPLLATKGLLIVAAPDAAGPADKMSTAYGKSVDAFLAKSKLFEKVKRVTIAGTPPFKFGEDGKANVVLAIREMHNWVRRNELPAYLSAIHAALADNGTFGLVAHRAKPGTKGEDTAESGYLAEDWVVAKVEAAGFRLVEKSEINANPKDTKDHPKGVWSLPPVYREGDASKAKYGAIGESDRMTLKFAKVAAK